MDENNIDKVLIDDERISLFMQGRMSAEEEALFKEELKSNIELRQRAISQARLVKGMKQADEELVNAFKQADMPTIKEVIEKSRDYTTEGKAAISGSSFGEDEVDNCGTSTSTSYSNTERTFSKRPLRWFAYAASIFIIVFVGYKGYDYYNTTSLGKQYANAFPIESIVRGDADTDVEMELTKLFKNVSKGENLKKTTARLAELWEIAKQDTYNDYTDYAPYIGWNLAIGYLEDYEKAKAEAVLLVMANMYPEYTIMGSKITLLINEL